MRARVFVTVIGAAACGMAAASTQGLVDLVRRRLGPKHVDSFSFHLISSNGSLDAVKGPPNDQYIVSNTHGKICIEGTSTSALATGLHRYLTDVVNVDISWFIGSRLHLTPSKLPKLKVPIQGSSVVPWRYHFNTVTFSYTTAFWSWADWELQLDWMALRGINLSLAWVGWEKILVEVFTEIGLTHDEIFDFLSGPAFQSWNRFGNIQDSWGGELTEDWVERQFALQKRIVKRMVDLGMTPVLPAFTGFVPMALTRVFPNATVVNGSQWEGFPRRYTNDTFLEPQDALFSDLQNRVVSKQLEYYGNVTNIFTLDQFNENNPASGDLEYLRHVSHSTWTSLKQANPMAIWMLQGWLFFSNSEFWTTDRVEAYLGGVEADEDMLILDLFSETQPQWQRLNSYYGKPWIWNELHDYGGNIGLYGQVENVTINAIEALAESSSMVGMGLTPEGQEGNEVMYDLLLDQAWSSTPLNTSLYFEKFAAARYGPVTVPTEVTTAWQALLHSVYNNTNLTTQAVTKSIFELRPNSTGLLNRVGHHPTTITYNTSELVHAWTLFGAAAEQHPRLWQNEAFTFDLADFTRQVLANIFPNLYKKFLSTVTSKAKATVAADKAGERMLQLLQTLDDLLAAAHPSFHLSTWEAAARSWAPNLSTPSQTKAASDLLAYNVRDQVTLWGPDGEISDYSSRQWSGLVGDFYANRWRIWIDEYKQSGAGGVDQAALHQKLLVWEEGWVRKGLTGLEGLPNRRSKKGLQQVVEDIRQTWHAELGL